MGHVIKSRGLRAVDAYWVAVNYVELWFNTVSHGGDGTNLEFNLHKTIRHEIGHTVGMWHTPVAGNEPPCGADTTDTMVQGWVPSGSFFDIVYQLYNDHHVCHVNAWV